MKRVLGRRMFAGLGDGFDLGEFQVELLETRANLREGGRFLNRNNVGFQRDLEGLYNGYREARVVPDDFRRFPP